MAIKLKSPTVWQENLFGKAGKMEGLIGIQYEGRRR